MTSYVLNVQPPVARESPQRALGPVTVREFRCPDHLCDGRIVYRPTPEEVGFYEYHRWAASPREMITRLVAADLRSRALFQEVVIHEASMDAAYVLSGTIEQLEEVDHGRDVRAVCTIAAQLRDARTRAVIWSGTASEAVPVRKRNVAGVVTGLSAAVRIAIDRLVASMEEDVRQ